MWHNSDYDKVWTSPFVIGLAGAVVALKGAPGKTWLERLVNAGMGTLMAGFLTPGVTEFFSLPSPAMHAAAAFAIGLFGMNLVAAANSWIREAKLSDVLPWAKKG